MKSKLFKLFLLVFVVFALVGCKEKEQEQNKPEEHTHELVFHEAVEATTEKEGNSAYYSCKGCDKYYSDKDGKNEIAKDSWVIAKIVVEDKGTYTIKVIDIDGEVLVNDKIAVDKYANVYEAITKENYDTVASMGDYGAFVTSIKGSIVDKNWSLMIYVNDVSSWDSADKITPKKDDVIEFRNECWAAVDYGYGASMDETDVLLDKVLYHYFKTYMKTAVEGVKDYTGSTYWEMLMIDLVKRSGMDTKVVDYNLTADLVKQLEETDLTTLTGANIGKYYSHAKVANKVSEGFNDFYTPVLEGLTSWSDNYADYTTPFVVFPAASLNLGNKVPEAVLKEAINGSTEFGPTGNLWKALGQSLFNDRSEALDLDSYMIAYEGTYDWASNVDNATALMVASAFGVDARNTKVTYEEKELDYVNYILTRYYDENLGFVKIYDNDTDLQPSTNQIYAGLLAYKAYRYTGKAANIFGPVLWEVTEPNA